jgi:single-strand DNA-binding protein
MNNHTIHGRLVRDPELTPRRNSDSSDRVNFTVAVDRRFGDESDFFDCVAFGQRAEVINKFFSKGKEIIVWGEGHINSYEGKDGVKRKSYSIFVDGFDFCGSKEKSSERKNEPSDSWNSFDEDNPF